MLKVDRLHNKVEPFAALFWALGIVYLAPDPARRHSTAVHKASPDMVIGVSILSEDALPALPPFLSMYCILFIYAGQYPTAP